MDRIGVKCPDPVAAGYFPVFWKIPTRPKGCRLPRGGSKQGVIGNL
jgi:hypothetical protein